MSQLSVRENVELVIKSLQISRDDFYEVNKNQWECILYNIEEMFIKKKHHAQDLHWSWESFIEPTCTLRFKSDDGYKHITELIDDEVVWFIAEDWNNKMWVYEAKVNVISKIIIPETLHLNEYYLASKKFEWLLCENHHRIFIGTGYRVVQKMKIFTVKHPNELFT